MFVGVQKLFWLKSNSNNMSVRFFWETSPFVGYFLKKNVYEVKEFPLFSIARTSFSGCSCNWWLIIDYMTVKQCVKRDLLGTWKNKERRLFLLSSHFHPPREARGPTGATSGPPRRPVCQCYSQGFECAVTGANLRRLAIMVSPRPALGGNLSSRLNRCEHLKLSDSSGTTMVFLHFVESCNVSPS